MALLNLAQIENIPIKVVSDGDIGGGSYTILSTDYLINYTGTANVSFLLGTIVIGREIKIRNASDRRITLTAQATTTINGKATLIMNNKYSSVILVGLSSTEWGVF